MRADKLRDALNRDKAARALFQGISLYDSLPFIAESKFALVLLDTKGVQWGVKRTTVGHWQVLLRDGDHFFFYCSLARPPSRRLKNYIKYKYNVLDLARNPYRVQARGDMNCGNYVINVITLFARGYNFAAICEYFRSFPLK